MVKHELKTYEEKKRASEELLRKQATETIIETAPHEIDEGVLRLAKSLSSTSPVIVPVVADECGLYGWCSDGVERKVQQDGGAILFGWTIWEFPRLFLTAEFHAVWQSPTGELNDITPKPQGERQIVFVPDETYPQDFDFDKRPRNHRARIYQPTIVDVRALVAQMKSTQREYEQRRASKAGKSLEEWVISKQPVDPGPDLIDEFLRICDAHDVKVDSFDGNFFTPDTELLELMRQKQRLLAKIKSLRT